MRRAPRPPARSSRSSTVSPLAVVASQPTSAGGGSTAAAHASSSGSKRSRVPPAQPRPRLEDEASISTRARVSMVRASRGVRTPVSSGGRPPFGPIPSTTAAARSRLPTTRWWTISNVVTSSTASNVDSRAPRRSTRSTLLVGLRGRGRRWWHRARRPGADRAIEHRRRERRAPRRRDRRLRRPRRAAGGSRHRGMHRAPTVRTRPRGGRRGPGRGAHPTGSSRPGGLGRSPGRWPPATRCRCCLWTASRTAGRPPTQHAGAKEHG